MTEPRADLRDFVALRARYEALDSGPKAELRRAAGLDELAMTPALYRLFPGERPDDRHLRLAFLLPWVRHGNGAKPIGAQLAGEHVAEARVIQVARAKSPQDIVQLRRLAIHVEPTVDWSEFGKTLWFWGEGAKRRLVEDFYLTQFSPAKGGKK